MSKCAGLDWSGTPYAPEEGVIVDLYVPTVIAIPDEDEAEIFLKNLFRRRARTHDFEVRGRKCSEPVLLAIIEFVLENACVAAMLLHKRNLSAESDNMLFNKPELLPPASALCVLDRLFQHQPIRKVIADQGDIGLNRFPAFRTAVHHIHSGYHPESRSLDVKPLPSQKSILIQLADVTAYVLQRSQRESFTMPELRKIEKKLWEDAKNQIWWGGLDDLRSYLPP